MSETLSESIMISIHKHKWNRISSIIDIMQQMNQMICGIVRIQTEMSHPKMWFCIWRTLHYIHSLKSMFRRNIPLIIAFWILGFWQVSKLVTSWIITIFLSLALGCYRYVPICHRLTFHWPNAIPVTKTKNFCQTIFDFRMI